MNISPIFVLIAMLFSHVFDDYVLQGCLANLKQKRFWENDDIGKNPKYRYDYICALIMHSISWSFCTMLPIALFIGLNSITFDFAICFAINVAVHAITDDLKANKLKINLIEDQSVHMIQIALTFVYFVILKG